MVSQPVETRDEAIMRLAAQARQRGIRVYEYVALNGASEFYATSHSQPDRLHRVTLWSCDCPGHMSVGRCTHHSALLAHVGELPLEDPDPDGTELAALVTISREDQIAAAQAEVDRLARIAKSTADWHNLSHARAHLQELTAGVRTSALAA